jgi:hypothetical protein
MPDTQYDAAFYPASFMSETQWIVANKNSQNIVFVTHVGDIVDVASAENQWYNADAAMDKLDAGNVAYSVGPGNHDIGSGSLYENYFGVSRFTGKSWYAGNYGGNNYNNYSLFSASGMDFILINLQYHPTVEMLDWADALLKANPSRRGIVESHEILRINDSWFSEYIYLALKDNPNLFLMVCGHDWNLLSGDGAAYRSEQGDDGHTIHIMLANYQGFSLSGNGGYLRILKFSPKNDKIYMTTYSPYKNRYITSYPDQMEMNYDMISGNETISVAVKIFLEGSYDPNNNEMTTLLNSTDLIPATSPYDEDDRTLNSIPVEITDWVLVQLRSTFNGSAITSRSALLHKDGWIVADDGINSQIEMNASSGNYYVVLKHRNHLAVMSNSTVTFSNPPTVTSYDFTIGDGSQFYGTNGAKELEPNVWGMIAGDANGDGKVKYNGAANDKNSILSEVGLITPNNVVNGYSKNDINMDGVVTYNGASNDKNKILAVVGLLTPNNIIQTQVP